MSCVLAVVVVAIVVDVVLCFAGDVEQVDVVADLDVHVGVADVGVVGQITKLHASATIEICGIYISLLEYHSTIHLEKMTSIIMLQGWLTIS